MKTIKYMIGDDQGNMTEDPVFGGRMERMAKAYARWDRLQQKVSEAVERDGWNAVYDRDGFKKADDAMDLLAKHYNICHGTTLTGEELSMSKLLGNIHLTAVRHGVV